MLTRRLRLLAITLILGTMLLDIGVLEIRYLVPNSVRPSDTNFINNPTDNGVVLVHLGERKGKPCEVLFIGASNVAHWQDEGLGIWNHYYAPRHAFNFGVSGDTTENVLWRMDHMDLSVLKPKVVVIFVGLNNLNDPPREIALGINAVIKKTNSLFPGVKILLTGLTPNVRNDAAAVEANKILRTYADDKSIFYIDLYSKMIREGSTWKGLGPDGVHFDKDGYELWAEQMEPKLSELLAEHSVATGSK